MIEDTERLHPETMKTLRELIKLHGAPRLLAAIFILVQEDSKTATEATKNMKKLIMKDDE
jgi:hypothetical protein